VTFRQGYGLTEVGVNCFAMSDEDSERKAGSIGRPMMFTEAKLADPAGNSVSANEVGELCLRGPHVCSGYWNNPAAPLRCSTQMDGSTPVTWRAATKMASFILQAVPKT